MQEVTFAVQDFHGQVDLRRDFALSIPIDASNILNVTRIDDENLE